ncbi:SEC-C domain-containing protein [Thalassospira povalilytica]|nr:SEC-C domain-containing protein [Thalassospira povalilytica]
MGRIADLCPCLSGREYECRCP